MAELKPQNTFNRPAENQMTDYLRHSIDRTDAYRRKVEEVEHQKEEEEESYAEDESSDSELMEQRKAANPHSQTGLNEATLELMRMKKQDEDEIKAKSQEKVAQNQT